MRTKDKWTLIAGGIFLALLTIIIIHDFASKEISKENAVSRISTSKKVRVLELNGSSMILLEE